jgi:leucyl/phenylalanyl-tRNA---protein transferase
VQFQTPHLARFGTIEIPRAEYKRRLAEALRYRGGFGAGVVGAGAAGGAGGATQSRTLTS